MNKKWIRSTNNKQKKETNGINERESKLIKYMMYAFVI